MSYNSGEISRKEILDAAIKVFVKKGFSGTRVQEIADEANMNKGMIFYYFKSKELLYQEVFIVILQKTLVKQFKPLTEDISIKEKLIKYGKLYIENASEAPELISFIVSELNMHTEKSSKLFFEKLNIDYSSLQNQCDSEAEQGLIRKIDFRDIILAISSFALFPLLGRALYTKLYNFDDTAEFIEFHKKRSESLERMIDNWLRPD